MLAPKLFRDDPDRIKRSLARRGVAFDWDAYARLEAERKRLQVEVEAQRAETRKQAKEIGRRKGAGEDLSAALAGAEAAKRALHEREAEFAKVGAALRELLLEAPNLLDDEVPDGQDEHDNVVVRQHLDPTGFAFKPLDHVALGERLGLFAAAEAAAMSGARFTVLYGALARLQRALTRFMLDMHTREHGYLEAYVPYIVQRDSLLATGQLPKFEHDLFALREDAADKDEARRRFLIPTAETPLANLRRDAIVQAGELPLKWVAHTPCFRAEAGAAGQDTRGMLRQHQFEKVELVWMTDARDSRAALETLTGHAEAVLKALELPYRVVLLCAGDTGFGAAMTYDIEVWLPGQQRYREISSCSNMTDFQARRLLTRVRRAPNDKPAWAHTLNGSGLAVGRALIAVMENCQTEDGRIRLPAALAPYMDDMNIIGPAGEQADA